ncbi:hypothetical protein FGB62_62g234 [Gracilaria domingensis]|nr:hypothetical protein FGB62_62g234 [Gracilaria domingensis]
MLGVVRVYSRKSEFILKDVQAIVDALKRLDVHTQSKSTGRKRTKDAAPSFSTRGAGAAAISLEHGQDLARLDMITLPVSKKRRTRTYALPARTSSLRNNEFEKGRDPSVVSFGAISSSQTPQLDVAEAMETLFPSVVVPRFGLSERAASGTPSSGIGSQTQRSLFHRAREEDITLAPSAGRFGDLRQELYLDDLPISLESQQPSLHIQPEPELSSGEDHDGIRPFGVGSDVPSSALGSVHPPDDILPPQQDVLAVPEPDEIEPLQIGPFAMGDSPFQRSGGGSLVEGVEGAGSPLPAKVSSVRTSPEETSSKKNVTSTSTAQPSTRTKRYARIRLDDVTELSPEQIRASLNDTSDIVLADGEERSSRRRGKRAGAPAQRSVFPLAVFSFPESITEMWNELTEDLVQPQVEMPASQAPSPKQQLSASDERSPGSGMGGSVSPAQPQGVPSPLSLGRLEVPLVEEEPIVAPGVPLPRTTPEPGSTEVLREGVFRQGTPAVLSHPSRSLRGTSGSRSFPSRSASLQARTARLRDHIFEMITEADERSFRIAREHSSGFRDAAQGRRSDSEEDFRASDATETRREGNDGRLELRASDFQLVEETQRDDSHIGHKGAPFESIGIHAYKMLELIRAGAESREIPSDADPEDKITTFGALVNNCSRKATARAFFNILSLANSGFIRVLQERPYASILISKGSFFHSE